MCRLDATYKLRSNSSAFGNPLSGDNRIDGWRVSMTNKVIPFPSGKSSPELDPSVVGRSRVMSAQGAFGAG